MRSIENSRNQEIEEVSSEAPQPILTGEKKVEGTDAKRHLRQQALQATALLLLLTNGVFTVSFWGRFFLHLRLFEVLLSIPLFGIVRYACILLDFALGICIRRTRIGKFAIVLSTAMGLVELTAFVYIWKFFDFGAL